MHTFHQSHQHYMNRFIVTSVSSHITRHLTTQNYTVETRLGNQNESLTQDVMLPTPNSSSLH